MNNSVLNIQENIITETFPSYRKPSVVGYFSLNSERKYCGNLSQLKYVRIPGKCNVKFNLDSGRKNAIKKNENIDEKLDSILKWILENCSNKEWISPNFVCYRGLLTLLMCTPYEEQEGWIICATKWKDTIFLCAKETEEKRQQREHIADRQMKFLSWGYKFEQYMSTEKPDGVPDVTVPVNEREELCVMFRTKLNDHNLLFGAEMDGVLSKTEIVDCSDLAQAEFVELKTSRKIDRSRQDYNFRRYKLIKWWGQSFLVGITKLVCGFRDDWGTVHKLEHFKVREFPKMAVNLWNPNVCMNFCDKFLSFVRSMVQEETADTVWKFEWKPNEDITAVKITGPSELNFLPRWFTTS